MVNHHGVALLLLILAAPQLDALLQDVHPRHPVVLVPGDGGSQVEAKLNKTYSIHYYCAKIVDWFDLWLNVEEMMPGPIDCWADNMRLRFDPKTRKTRNNDGVETRIPGFGNTTTVEYLDPSRASLSLYFGTVVNQLVKLGYKRGVDIHGAPYDFRKAPNELGEYLDDLKKLIESTYEKNGRRKVIFIVHSMGAPMTLYFLNHQTQAWKDKYIKSFISMAGVWAGTVRAMKVFAIGDDLDSWLIKAAALRLEQRTNPSLAFLMPSPRYWKPDEVLMQSPELNVTVKNLEDFYLGFNETNGRMIWEDTKDLVKDMTPPGVDVYCLHGAGVASTEKLVYTKFPGSSPTLLKGDGDGTVNIRSLMACTEWEKANVGKKFHHKVFHKFDHLGLLRDDGVAKYVKDIVESQNEELPYEINTLDLENQFEYPDDYPIIDIV